MRLDLLRIIKKYKIPLSEINKEVLIDEELYHEAASFLDEPHIFYAFPGFFFKFKNGFCHERGRKALSISEEYGVDCIDIMEPKSGSNVFAEPEHGEARDFIESAVFVGIDRGVFIARESILVRLIAEPGWREYSPLSVVTSLFYEIDAFRVENQAFFFGRSPMGMAFLEKKKYFNNDFVKFVRNIFKRGKIGSKRVEKIDPEEILEMYDSGNVD